MKTFTATLIFVVLAVSAFAAPAPEPSENGLFEKNAEQDLGYVQYDPEFAELLRQKKSYGAPSYSAPSYSAPSYSAPAPSRLVYSAPAPTIPCSKAIVVSCAPSVMSAPCSAPPASGY